MAIIPLILTIVVVGLLVWGALEILKAIPMQETFKTVARVLIIVAAVLYLLNAVFGVNINLRCLMAGLEIYPTHNSCYGKRNFQRYSKATILQTWNVLEKNMRL